MKNIFRLTCLAIALCFTTLPAQAIEFEPYTGVGLGGVIIDAGLGGEKAFAGYGILGADLHENYGVELRFGSTGNSGKTVIIPQTVPGQCFQATNHCGPGIILVPTPATISVDWFFSYLFKLQYPLADAFTIYGLVGGTTLNSKFTIPLLGRTRGATNTTLSYGGGIDYSLANRWIWGVDWMIYANSANTDPGSNYRGLDVWGFSTTIKYKF